MGRGRTTLTLVVVAAAAVVGAVAAWAGGADTQAATVRVVEKEFTLKPTPVRVAPGKVTFVVRNAGSVAHEFVVLKTTIAPGKLPVRNNRAVERGKVGETPRIPAGATKRLTLTLKAGKYVLLCNLPPHYKLGQFAGFRVGS